MVAALHGSSMIPIANPAEKPISSLNIENHISIVNEKTNPESVCSQLISTPLDPFVEGGGVGGMDDLEANGGGIS